jgi:hypothetical protein
MLTVVPVPSLRAALSEPQFLLSLRRATRRWPRYDPFPYYFLHYPPFHSSFACHFIFDILVLAEMCFRGNVLLVASADFPLAFAAPIFSFARVVIQLLARYLSDLYSSKGLACRSRGPCIFRERCMYGDLGQDSD